MTVEKQILKEPAVLANPVVSTFSIQARSVQMVRPRGTNACIENHDLPVLRRTGILLGAANSPRAPKVLPFLTHGQMASCLFFWFMTLLNRSSSQDARAQNWPSVNQGLRSDTMADEPEDPHVNRDELFHIVRDGEYVDAKKALAKADMAWRHTALQQNFLFFIAARRRRGSELLAKQCIEMGVNLEEVDLHGQTPLFWAAKRGNLVIVKFLLNLGFEVNFRDKARKTALFFAIEKSHMDVVDYLIERSASIRVRASDGKTPQTMLKALNHKAPSRKRELVSPTPSFVCPGAATRSRFAQWEWAGAQEETEPLIEKKEDNVLVENQQYLSRQVSTDVKLSATRTRKNKITRTRTSTIARSQEQEE